MKTPNIILLENYHNLDHLFTLISPVKVIIYINDFTHEEKMIDEFSHIGTKAILAYLKQREQVELRDDIVTFLSRCDFQHFKIITHEIIKKIPYAENPQKIINFII